MAIWAPRILSHVKPCCLMDRPMPPPRASPIPACNIRYSAICTSYPNKSWQVVIYRHVIWHWYQHWVLVSSKANHEGAGCLMAAEKHASIFQFHRTTEETRGYWVKLLSCPNPHKILASHFHVLGQDMQAYPFIKAGQIICRTYNMCQNSANDAETMHTCRVDISPG